MKHYLIHFNYILYLNRCTISSEHRQSEQELHGITEDNISCMRYMYVCLIGMKSLRFEIFSFFVTSIYQIGTEDTQMILMGKSCSRR